MPIHIDIDWSRRVLQVTEDDEPGLILRRQLRIPPYIVQGVGSMAYTLPLGKIATAHVTVTDTAGNPSVVDGVPAWSVVDPAVLEVTAADDGMSATLSPKTLGATQLHVTADAMLGEGTKLIEVFDEITVAAGEAATLTLDYTVV
jgi:hypothetical protein